MKDLMNLKPMYDIDDDGKGGDGNQSGKTEDATKITLSEKALAERLARAEKKAQSEFLKNFGFEKPEDFKAFVDKVKADEEAKKTDLQKAQDAAKAAELERTQALADAKKMKFEASLEREALKRGIDPDKMSYVTRLLDVPEEADAATMGAAIDALIKDMPSLKPTKQRGGADFSGGTGDDNFDLTKMTAEDFANPEIWKKVVEAQKRKR